MTHPEHAAQQGVTNCTAFTMGHRGCLTCGWQMFPPAHLAQEAAERLAFREMLAKAGGEERS